MFTLENWIGLSGILWAGTALFILLIAVPFVDHNARRHWRRRPVAMTLATAVVLAIVVLSILAVTTPAAQHLMRPWPAHPIRPHGPGTPSGPSC